MLILNSNLSAILCCPVTLKGEPVQPTDPEPSNEATEYRWLIVGIVLSFVAVAVIIVLLFALVRHRRLKEGKRYGKSLPITAASSGGAKAGSARQRGVGGRRNDADIERRRRQEKYFDTLCTDGYYNWTYDPDMGDVRDQAM